jgi:hypothetical protein
MVSTTYFGNKARLWVGGNVVSVLRGLEVRFDWEVAELYGTDSIFRVDEAKHNLKIYIKIRYSKWDCDVTTDLGSLILRPSGATGAVEETNTLYLTTAVITTTGTAGDTLTFNLSNVYFNKLPYPLPENDFIVRELEGYARGGYVSNV